VLESKHENILLRQSTNRVLANELQLAMPSQQFSLEAHTPCNNLPGNELGHLPVQALQLRLQWRACKSGLLASDDLQQPRQTKWPEKI
jgi:hypothetical protein